MAADANSSLEDNDRERSAQKHKLGAQEEKRESLPRCWLARTEVGCELPQLILGPASAASLHAPGFHARLAQAPPSSDLTSGTIWIGVQPRTSL
jgi:hypothetical protein